MRRICVFVDFSLTILLIVTVLCTLAQPAYAYVDPGSGLLVIQMIGASFAGFVLLLRRRLRRLFGTKTSEAKDKVDPV